MKDIFNEIILLKKKKFIIFNDMVNYIINNNIDDINMIEYCLDNLFDVCYDDEEVRVFYLLCDYYEKINKENSDFYRKELKKFI